MFMIKPFKILEMLTIFTNLNIFQINIRIFDNKF